MSLNDATSDFDEEKFDNLSSESSDSESYLEEDIKNSGDHINKQWEAIERTLYEEDGQKVTDPELLRECKLWRETFPHFRVKGTKISVKESEENNDEEACKSVQTLGNHFNLTKLNEKREIIKKKVVGELVERLIAKFGTSKNCQAEAPDFKKKGVVITEISDTDDETWKKKNSDLVKNSNKTGSKNSSLSAEKESYFERGKVAKNVEENMYVSKDEMEKSLIQIFDSWGKDEKKSALKSPLKTSNSDSLKMPNQFKSVNFDLRHSTIRHVKPKSNSPTPNSLGDLAKPFVMTKKIDKKYEGLLEKIMTRRCNELEPLSNIRTTNSGTEIKRYQEALQRLRIDSGFDEYYRKNKNLPKINNFSNKWLERGDLHNYSGGDVSFKKAKNKTKSSKDLNIYRENMTQGEMDERFIEDLKREMALNYKRPPRRSGGVEEISLRRPKPFKPLCNVGKNQRSSSCSNLPKSNKKNITTKLKSGEDLHVSSKQRAKSTNLQNKPNRYNGTKNAILPPIESGIICTELTGRPKIGFKNPRPPKRH